MPRNRRGWAMRDTDENRTEHSPLRIALLEPTLLILLKEQQSHGYTLLNSISEIGINTIHPSIVYRTLREIEDLGWISSDWDTNQTQGPPRRVYQITDLGNEVIKNWQRELNTTQEIIQTLLDRIH